MPEKLLTISIASYNVETYIGDTVGSLLIDKNRMGKLEIIIVNDGSKDNTSFIAHELEKQYPETIMVIDKPNGGYGSTINTSLGVARGRYYKLLDGDDWFNTSSLGDYIDYLEDNNNDLIVSPYYEVKDNQRELIDAHCEIPSDGVCLEKAAINNSFFAMHEIAIRTEKLKNLNRHITEHCFYTDSEYVFYCICAAETIARFDKPVYCYRLGVEGQSVSLDGIRKHYADLPRVCEQLINCYTENGRRYKETKKEILDLCIQNITYHTYRAFLLLEKPEKYKKELVLLDGFINSKSKEAYLLGSRGKLVRLIRLFHFVPYKLICKIALRQFYKEQ